MNLPPLKKAAGAKPARSARSAGRAKPASSAVIPERGICAGCWRNVMPLADDAGVLRCPMCKAEWRERRA